METIGKVHFSEKGYEKFKKMTKEKQKEYLKERMPLATPVEIDRLLEHRPYAKLSKSKKSTKKSSKPSNTSGDSK